MYSDLHAFLQTLSILFIIKSCLKIITKVMSVLNVTCTDSLKLFTSSAQIFFKSAFRIEYRIKFMLKFMFHS